MPRPDCIWEGQTHSNCVAVEDTKPNVPAEHSRGIEDFANIPVGFKNLETFFKNLNFSKLIYVPISNCNYLKITEEYFLDGNLVLIVIEY